MVSGTREPRRQVERVIVHRFRYDRRWGARAVWYEATHCPSHTLRRRRCRRCLRQKTQLLQSLAVVGLMMATAVGLAMAGR
jgi:hypothetical protein